MNNLTKTFIRGLALSLAVLPQAWAGASLPCETNETNCWQCGNNCYARLDSNGKMTVAGTGNMYNYGYTQTGGLRTTAPWKDVSDQVKTVEVIGVSNIGNSSFIGFNNMENIKIGNTVTSLGSYSIDACPKLKNVYIPSSVTTGGDFTFYNNPSLQNIVMDQNTNLSNRLYSYSSTNVLRYDEAGDLIYLYDKDRNVIGIYDSYTNLETSVVTDKKMTYAYDDEGNILLYNSNNILSKKYDKDNHILASYKYDRAGNLVAQYDKNGIAIYTKTLYTPTEAAAAANKGNNNTVTITFK